MSHWYISLLILTFLLHENLYCFVDSANSTPYHDSLQILAIGFVMAEDREILRETWDGQIPVCFCLATDDVYTLQQPDPYYLMVPRVTYFPIVTDKVQKHFKSYIKEEYHDAEMWLEYGSQPLRWHYPVGLLYDLYGADSDLPWKIIVHFQNFPEKELIHCTNKDAVQSHFMAVIKEASVLKHRVQLTQNMQPKDHKELWNGLQNDKFDQFWGVNKRLMENPGEHFFKYIPFRLYQPNMPVFQQLIKPQLGSGELTTLQDLMTLCVPNSVAEIGSKYKLISHGIEIPLETPLQWLSEHCSYPDNFLHLVLLPAS